MRCDFCGEDIENDPYQKDGMSFCSLECSDAMESGETISISEELIDDPDDLEDEEEFDILSNNGNEFDEDDDDFNDDDADEDEYEEDLFGNR